MLPHDEKNRMTHREFVEGAVGTLGESNDSLRQRIVDTISREELETQARIGVLNAEGGDEQVFGAGDQREESAELGNEEVMDEEELHSLFVAIDTGALSVENVCAVQKRIQ